jgi:DNA topoisomerase VI subunit B
MIRAFVKVYEEILKEVYKGRPFEVDVAIIFSGEIWNVQNDIAIFRLTAAWLIIS